ncbi:MAG: hypothetical protein ACYSW4_01570 [Planctomycetota bacterium]|jgi:hypothetical protein
MMEKLSQRDKRALKFGAVCVAAILVLVFAAEWLGHWMEVRESLNVKRSRLKAISVSEADQKDLRLQVPVFEMPQREGSQKHLFRDKLREQLKKTGIKSKPLQVLTTRKSRETGYKLLRLKCSGKCNFGQVLDLLAGLKENPYLVGIEEFEITCDPKKRQEFELNLTVSTFVR